MWAIQIYPLLFQNLSSSFAKGLTRAYTQTEARELFNASWAGAAVFTVDETIFNSYPEAVMVALHRDNQADAYVLYFFKDYDAVKGAIKQSLDSLKFQ